MREFSYDGGSDQWNVFSQDVGGSPFVIRRRAGAAFEEFARERPLALISLAFPPNRVNEQRLPRRISDIEGWEAHLSSLMIDHHLRAWLVGVATGDAHRNFFFAVDDRDALDALPIAPPAGLEVVAGPVADLPAAWALLTPVDDDALAAADAEVLDALRAANDCADVVRDVELRFAGDPARLRGLAQSLGSSGLVVRDWGAGGTILLMTRPSVTDEASIRVLTRKATRAANGFGVEFRGWGCAVCRAPAPLIAARALFGRKRA